MHGFEKRERAARLDGSRVEAPSISEAGTVPSAAGVKAMGFATISTAKAYATRSHRLARSPSFAPLLECPWLPLPRCHGGATRRMRRDPSRRRRRDAYKAAGARSQVKPRRLAPHYPTSAQTSAS